MAIDLSPPSAITYHDGATQRIYAFVVKDGQTLHANYWKGNGWQWGGPLGGLSAAEMALPQALTYMQGGVRQIAVMTRQKQNVWSQTQHLYVCHWDGDSWDWVDRGAVPPGTTFNGETSTITSVSGANLTLTTFAVLSDGQLHRTTWNGSNASPPAGWTKLPAPAGVDLPLKLTAGAALNYADWNHGATMAAFLGDDSGRLVYHTQNSSGSAWHTGTKLPNLAANYAVVHEVNSQDAVLIFRKVTPAAVLVVTERSSMTDHYLGTPSGAGVHDIVGVISYDEYETYMHPKTGEELEKTYHCVRVFVIGTDHKLYMCWWRTMSLVPAQPIWTPLGAPAGFSSHMHGSGNGVTTYLTSAGARHIHAFVSDLDGRLLCCWSHDQNNFTWSIQGSP